MGSQSVQTRLGVRGAESASALQCWESSGQASREACRETATLQRLRLALSRLVVWPYTNEAAQQFGRVFADLRRIGRPMQQIDIMVAAIASTLGNCTVVTKDSDLNAVPGLAVENWVVP